MEIIQRQSTNVPLVSISVLVYNHERYICQALDSILAQKVNFDYEIVIAEDCSTDRSREIVIGYKKKYTDIIKLILHSANVGMNRNAQIVSEHCGGKYRAICEGDDYWTDRHRLQRQVDFLEDNPTYIGTVGRTVTVNFNGDIYNKSTNKKVYCTDQEYGIKHVEKMLLPGHLSALMYRNIFLDMDEKSKGLYYSCEAEGDRKLALLLAIHGKIYCDNKIVSHYRRVTEYGTSWSAVNNNRNRIATYIKWAEQLMHLAKCAYKINLDYSEYFKMICYPVCVRFIKRPTRKNASLVKQVFNLSKNKAGSILYIIKMVLGWPFRKSKRLIKKYIFQ